MRKNIVFIFIFVFWGLAVCTILSAKIEEQMTAEVILCKKEEAEGDEFNSQKLKLPLDALFYDEEGTAYLYKVINGEGWEIGKRISEVGYEDYEYVDNAIVTYYTRDEYVRYASKMIQPGQLVRATAFSMGDTTEYLIMKEKESARIVRMEGQNPYMEEPVRTALEISAEESIYYLNDVRMFLGTLPLLASIVTVLLCSIIVWGYSWWCVKDWKKNKTLLAVNGGIYIILFFMFRQLVQKVAFPSSLLPNINIFDWGYYRQEFSQIFWGLQEVGGTVWNEMMEIYTKHIMISVGIVVIGVLCCSVVLVIEKKFGKVRK